MKTKTNCIFCKIANKTIDSVVIWEDSEVLAFLDLGPIREGHCQIIPKKHFESFELLPSHLSSKIFSLGQQLARRMKTIYQVPRVAFLFTGGDIPHAHAHIIPMVEKTDVTSARYITNPKRIKYNSSHLETSKETLLKVKAKLSFKLNTKAARG